MSGDTHGGGATYDRTRIAAHPLVATLDYHAEINSTNTRAKRLTRVDAPLLPCLVLAERQTAGRGRGANRWSAPPGAVTLSLLLRPSDHHLAGDRLPALSIATASAVCDAVERIAGARLLIKWPNDVVDESSQKYAGVLLESPRPDRVVIGVGLNLNASPDLGPTAYAARPGDVATLAGVVIDPTDAVLTLLDTLSSAIASLVAAPEKLAAVWNARNSLGGRYTRLRIGNEQVAGRCVGIAPSGALRLEAGDCVTEHVAGTVLAVG